MSLLERGSRDWSGSWVGLRDSSLFASAMGQLWLWASPARFIRLFTDGERRYSQALWLLAQVWLASSQFPQTFPYRKVWRESLYQFSKIEVQMSSFKSLQIKVLV